jgi:hypothetical protein
MSGGRDTRCHLNDAIIGHYTLREVVPKVDNIYISIGLHGMLNNDIN